MWLWVVGLNKNLHCAKSAVMQQKYVKIAMLIWFRFELCNALYVYIYIFVCIQWVYSGRPRDRSGQLISDVIDIDADHEEAQFEADGSGNGVDDDDDDDAQSGDGAGGEPSGGMIIYTAVVVYICCT